MEEEGGSSSAPLGGVAYRVAACTSEDSEHPASAVLSPTSGTYWQTDAPEKKAAIELALSHSVPLERILIGNAGAAFVEILVGKSTSRPIDYQVLQPIKPLCSMSESKSGANRYAGYLFSDKFDRNVAKQSWDRVKIICTQPWNLGPLGLSYVAINPTDDVSHLLKPGPSSSSIPKPAASSSSTSAPVPSVPKTVKPSTTTTSSAPASNAKQASNTKPSDDAPPFSKLMAGVTFVISGIQNPERADIRDKATAMGAKYQANWDSRATHLVCAFQDTPKYREVKGKGGIIVKPQWILDSYAQKKRLPLTKYTFEKYEAKEETEDGEDEREVGGAAVEEPEVGLVDKRKKRTTPLAQAVEENDQESNTEEMDELDLGPTLPLGTTDVLASKVEQVNDEDDDDLLPTLAIGGYDEAGEGSAATTRKTASGDGHNEDSGTEELDGMLPTIPLGEYTEVAPKVMAGAAPRKDDAKHNEKQEEVDISDLPTLAMDEAEPEPKDKDQESNTEEMDEADLEPTLAIPDPFSVPGKQAEKEKSKAPKEDEDSGTEEMDEVDLLPTLPITTAPEATATGSKRKRDEVAADEESSGTEVMSGAEEMRTKPKTNSKSVEPTEKKQKGATTKPTTKTSTSSSSSLSAPPSSSPSSKESLLGHQCALQRLPDFLEGVNVFIHGKELDSFMRQLVRRYVIAYKGRVSPHLYDDVTHVITTDDWGRDFERALKEHPKLIFVRPDWVLQCHHLQTHTSEGQYLLSKPS